VSGGATIELINAANPYEIDGPVWYLSTDLLVFRTIPNAPFPQGLSLPSLLSTGDIAQDCKNFIQAAITAFQIAPSIFDLAQQQLSHDLSLSSHDNSNNLNPVFNFAFARVRCRTSVDVPNVRVFFRMFPALTTSTIYDPSNTDLYARYRRSGPPGPLPLNSDNQPIPLLGIDAQDNIISIPFFAEPRVLRINPNADMTMQADPVNVQKIMANQSGAEVDNYFGCWLDFNQPFDLFFPYQPAPPAIGPFPPPNSGLNYSIQELVANSHQCLVAEIAYDPDPIPSGASPASSDKLAQQNLSIVGAANPGSANSRRISNTFELKMTSPRLERMEMPDELMIDWRNTPANGQAMLYAPRIDMLEVLELAGKMYPRHGLRRLDDHTLQCATGGITYIPIPRGRGNYVGLLTVDLPAGLRKGQQFSATVRQISSEFEDLTTRSVSRQERVTGTAAQKISGTIMRRVIGAFQISTPVRTKEELLPAQERLLSVLRWIERRMPTQSRWYLVFRRYVDQIAERVQGLGGNPDTIGPSPRGEWHKAAPTEDVRLSFTGKISGLVYDRFGDFSGFLLNTEDGERRFDAIERTVERLVRRAWMQRNTTTVFVEGNKLHCPVSIILGGMPPIE
jgi:hypothetical protein